MARLPIQICEEEFRRMYLAGAHRLELAAHFSCSKSTVHKTAARLGLPPREEKNPTPEEIEIRKRECDERRLAAMRGEDVPTTKRWRKELTRSA
jgi:hypothetical protein